MEQRISLPETKENSRDIFPVDRFTTTTQAKDVRCFEEQGYRRKNKAERFLEANRKQEAKLIGFDESSASMVVPESIDVKAMKIQDDSPASKHRSITRENRASEKNSQSADVPCTGSAKSRLYEICAINYWKAPTFECCKEDGPDHLKSFIFKVTVEMEEASKTVVECFSERRSSKKAAAEHAAEGALWYLKHQGYSTKE